MALERKKVLVVTRDTREQVMLQFLTRVVDTWMCSLSDNSLSCMDTTVMYSFLYVKVQTYFSTCYILSRQ